MNNNIADHQNNNNTTDHSNKIGHINVTELNPAKHSSFKMH